MTDIPLSSSIPRSQRHVESIPVGTWERDNFRCPPANKKTMQEILSDIGDEERGGMSYNHWCYIRANNKKEK